MTSRERLLTVLRGEIPDCVPVAPDFSNMIPARMTGKPFWDLYLYNDPPIWDAYIDCAKHFDIDSLMDGYFPLTFPEEEEDGPEWERYITFRDNDRIITQAAYRENGGMVWSPRVDVYSRNDPPNMGVALERMSLPPVPESWEPLEGVKPADTGPEGLRHIKELLGDQGLVGIQVTCTLVLQSEQDVFDYYDHPEKHEEWSRRRVEEAEARFNRIMALPEDCRPDFLCVGGSGSLIFQTPDVFRQLAFPAAKRVIELAAAEGILTHVHCCGPEAELIRMFTEETKLTVIDPLEVPPMGDCDLADIKKRFGDKIVLKGNLHTTDVMLRGTRDDVVAASKKAIDDAAAGGRFMLSTGDQCGRDTPDENLRAMVETARTYGRY